MNDRGSFTAVAMSGGLDSSVAASLLARSGERVVGLSMLLSDQSARVRSGRCCGSLDLADARRVARQQLANAAVESQQADAGPDRRGQQERVGDLTVADDAAVAMLQHLVEVEVQVQQSMPAVREVAAQQRGHLGIAPVGCQDQCPFGMHAAGRHQGSDPFSSGSDFPL